MRRAPSVRNCRRMAFYLLVVLVALWAIGLAFGFAGKLIHLLLVFAAVLMAVELVSRSRPQTRTPARP